MGWSGSITANSADGASTTFTPSTSSEGAYTVSSFKAPKAGVYRFQLDGSGGSKGSTQTSHDGTFTNANLAGGKGGYTIGFLKLAKDETVYVGAGGPCSAAFVSSRSGTKLSNINKSYLYFVAGGGGAAGRTYSGADYTQFGTGGNGGGASGANGTSNNGNSTNGGGGGTQYAGGAGGTEGSTKGNAGSYGAGGAASYAGGAAYAWGGRGGDGYYGGGSGGCVVSNNSSTGDTSSYAFGGGGGSGYVKTKTLTVNGKSYTSSTTAGYGSSSGANGSVVVTLYAKGEIPVFFNGTQIERLFYNGTEVTSLIHNGTKIFMERLRRRIDAWYTSIRMATALKARI